MKVHIVNKNALRMEGTSISDTDFADLDQIVIGKIGLGNSYNPTMSGSAFLILDVYLYYKDFENEV